ncbi:MAG: UMP kinase [Candidatus Sumerlaeota bacterium]|nr:UMP kinase [Candidatus Sumerlaeota bacterium]
MSAGAAYRRVILKLSGEALKGAKEYGVDPDVVRALAADLKQVADLGVQMGIVVGGGNIFRGIRTHDLRITRTVADQIGMLATMMNSLALQDALESLGVGTRVMSAIEMNRIAEPYIRRKAMSHLAKNLLVIFACGTGNPFFSTDTAGALRASEVDAQVLLKATNVDGIYTADPKTNKDARFLRRLSYQQFLTMNLQVMDASAIDLCRQNRLPIVVFNLGQPGNILRAVRGEDIGTLIDCGMNNAAAR